MKRRILVLVLLAFAIALPFAHAQMAATGTQPRAVVSLYRVAPGKHLEFLKWMAARDRVAHDAGLPATRWYAHVDGDAWDYVAISPETTPEQDRKVDELSRQRGLSIGMKAALEFRGMIAWHTDTLTVGPVAADDLLKMAQ
ncbi:hypothetical protein MBSD_n0256 [Mizugakiibacter sediminis]|uniref:Uncharacterized protein n=1 Tax=Mizugakiibacter sediminis TaxID=1475481 RepID=A0A0K8QJE2_9GAMM|nr:hypothetical protein [Mizugakiibacter sediminis]GAP64973.1 hypothetical protein MBSD_n0256 [Mizugakiibacter sediminis]